MGTKLLFWGLSGLFEIVVFQNNLLGLLLKITLSFLAFRDMT